MADVADVYVIAAYSKRATGEKVPDHPEQERRLRVFPRCRRRSFSVGHSADFS